MQRTRTTISVPVTATAETTSQTTTTSPARALVERVGNEAGEDSQPVHKRRIVAQCEDAITSDAIAEERRIHLEKLTKSQRRSSSKSRHAPMRPPDPGQDVGWTPCATIERGRPGGRRAGTSKLSTETMMHLKKILVEAALKGHDAAIGRPGPSTTHL